MTIGYQQGDKLEYRGGVYWVHSIGLDRRGKEVIHLAGEDGWEIPGMRAMPCEVRLLEQAPEKKPADDQWDDERPRGIRTGKTFTSKLPPPPPEHREKPEPKKKHKSAAGSASERWKILNNLVDFTMRKLRPAELRVWLVLFRDSKGGTAATAQSDIARRAGIACQASVSAAIKGLEEKGLITVVRRGGYRKGMSRYRVHGLEPTD